MIKRSLLFCFLIVPSFLLNAQNAGEVMTSYNPHDLFTPLFYPQCVSETRAATGEPGSAYWQNRADYEIKASLNEQAKEITGTVVISYRNNSPQNLSFLWLMLEQNLFSNSSRGQKRLIAGMQSRYGDAETGFAGGYQLKQVKVNGQDADYITTDTRMQIRLKEALPAAGGELKIQIGYSFVLPQYGADRCGIQPTKNGDIFALAQWYPRMCVFDDVQGWNTDPYLGPSEFYTEYGDFDISITAPASHVVVCSGELLNAKEALSEEQQKRMEAAKQSDRTVLLRSEKEMLAAASAKGTVTWHYSIKNARDAAWASSKSFIWDAARINLPGGKTSLAMSVYPAESSSSKSWGRATEYVKGSIENYSKRWFVYPYPSAVNVATNINGMEYPGIVFCPYTSQGSSLFGVTDHEFGHTWFPMIVGSNERKYGWMDEGFNVFINSLSRDDFNNGEYKRSSAQKGYNSQYMFAEGSETVMSTPDAMGEYNIGTALYSKPGYGLELLRNEILGADRFDYAFKTYIQRWAYKHPTPWDFFRTMENAAGENLGWFWKGWFIENYKLDQAVLSVEYRDNDEKKGAFVNIANLGQMAMPAYIFYETVSGKKGSIRLPVEIWNNSAGFRVLLPVSEKLASVIIDPDMIFPDINFDNNKWKSK